MIKYRQQSSAKDTRDGCVRESSTEISVDVAELSRLVGALRRLVKPLRIPLICVSGFLLIAPGSGEIRYGADMLRSAGVSVVLISEAS